MNQLPDVTTFPWLSIDAYLPEAGQRVLVLLEGHTEPKIVSAAYTPFDAATPRDAFHDLEGDQITDRGGWFNLWMADPYFRIRRVDFDPTATFNVDGIKHSSLGGYVPYLDHLNALLKVKAGG